MAKTIPVLWFSLLVLAALSASEAQQTKRPTTKTPVKGKAKTAVTPKANSKSSPKAAPKNATAAPAKSIPAMLPTGLAGMVRLYRETPSVARRDAVENYAVTHPREASAARLALGVTSYEGRDYASAIAALRKAQPKSGPIADYVSYYLAAARVEARDFDGIPAELRPLYASEVVSPFAARGWILQARAMKENAPADAVNLLRDHYAELPQPEGDINLADCYLAAGERNRAIEIYQRTAAQYLTGDASNRANAALAGLQEAMGPAYSQPSPQLLLRHADRLMETRSFRQARAEYRTLATQLKGLERDQARVRMGVADFQDAGTAAAYPYLRQLNVGDSEADAERLAYLLECARKLTDDDEMKSLLEKLQQHYAHSPWRMKALLSAANRYLLINRPDEYVPMYRAVYQDFPNAPEAALAHWRVTFQAYLHDDPQAQPLLTEHLRSYPTHPTAGASLYFLGRWYERSGDPGAARACFRKLTSTFENTYYSLLARQRKPVDTAPKSATIGTYLDSLKLPAARAVPLEMARNTGLRIERSRLLRGAGLNDIADSELRFAARTDAQPQLIGLEMASEAEAPHQAMRIMKTMGGDYLNLPFSSAPRKYWELLFPLPYRTDLERTARAAGVDPFLLAGLIRQESEFNPQALSRASAYGLTQVLPSTGKDFARRAGIVKFTNRLLFQPETNLKLGSAILRSMLDHNDGRVEETLASYNAGPSRPAAWITWGDFREPAEFVESIPFTETRDYVQAVLRNADIYRRLYIQ